MKVTYTGTDERVFPTLGITVQPGDEFDAPEGFASANVSGKTFTKSTASASSDPISSEVKE